MKTFKLSAVLCSILILSGCTMKTNVPSSSAIEAMAPISEAIAQPVPTASSDSSEQPTKAVSGTVHFSATGDNLIHDGIYMQAAARANGKGYDFNLLYADMKDFYKQFDVNWINQETLITDELAPSSYPCFCTPEALGNAAYDLGFRVFATSNNHSYDKGAAGIAATLRYWDKMPEDAVTTGFFNDKTMLDIPINEVNGVKIAYLAYTQYTNGIPMPQGASARVIMTSETDIIKAQIAKARELADFVIVGVHWGVEGSHKVSEAQKQLGKELADYGADAIIGTHPHVIQTLEYISSSDNREVPIVYSLGNFVSSQNAADNLIGMICSFDIVQNSNGEYEAHNLGATPIITHYGARFSKIHVMLYDDYTSELAVLHGTHEFSAAFSKEYIDKVIASNIPKEYLKMR